MRRWEPSKKLGSTHYVWGDLAKDLPDVFLIKRNTGEYQADMADEVNEFMAMTAAAIATKEVRL